MLTERVIFKFERDNKQLTKYLELNLIHLNTLCHFFVLNWISTMN